MPDTNTITKISLPNGDVFNIVDKTSGYLTSYTETDPTVPSWAKASTKPTYSLTEISGTDDLRVIEGLTGTSGLLRKTAANTWSLDTKSYLTSYTETDPIFSASAAANITSTDITNWNSKTSNTGTVTQVSTGTGLSGGPITTSGTITLNTAKTSKNSSGLGGVQVWKNWESNATITAPSNIGSYSGTVTVQNESTVSDRYYAVEATYDGHLIVNVPWTNVNNSYLTSETDPTVPSWAKASTKPSYGLTEISGTDDLRAIEGLTGTSGFLKKTAANTWTLDTNTYLTSYTETDPTVPSWAKASSKPTYTASEVGASPTGHTHATTLAAGASGDTSTITLESAGKYKLTAGGTSAVFTMPTIPTVNYPVTSVNTKTGAVTLTASDVGASATGHTHATSIATSSGTNQVTLAASTKYAITAGGTSYVFTTPPNTTYTFNSTYNSSTNKAATMADITWSNVGSKPTTLSGYGITDAAVSGHTHAVSITPSTTSVYSITGVGTASVPTVIDTTKFNGGSFTRGTFSGGSGSFTQGAFNGGSGSFTQGAFSGGSLTMSINGTDSKQLDITFTAATHGADSHTHVAATHGADSHTHTAATHAADSFTAASLGTGFYTAGTASTVPTRSQVSNLWNGYTAASAS